VWAAVLDGDLEDLGNLFALLSGVADRVVEELHVAVEGPERVPVAAPTTSLEAYDAYLRGREFKMRSWSPADTRASIELLERAVALDPGFALAHAWLAFAHTEAFWLNGFPADHLDRAREAAELALRLDPALPDAHKAMGHLLYVCCEDYDRALAHLKQSHSGRPGDAQVVMFIGNLHKRQGRWDDALAYYERASGLDPGWPAPFFNIAQMELWRRRYDRVERAIDRALALDPQAAFAFSMGAWVPLLRDGDSDGARRVLHRAAQTSEAFESIRLPFYLALLDRDYAAAARVAERGSHSGEAFDEWLDSDHLRRGVLSRLIGDEAAATLHFDSARLAIEQGLRDALPRSRRTQAVLRSALAVSYAAMGRRSEAMGEADRVRTLDPVAIDAISGPISLQNIALAYVFLDEHDAALDVLEQLVRIPARLSPALLRVDPLWDPLRPHPRFTRLVAP
ncbi:MAG: tetratricopeptide repeat protein, partial [Gemmatimonadetes bacterium]|nr:tetratricopeptide repeat protein [Gemmatimonadota bacterium]